MPTAGTSPQPFGFTGELQRGDLVYLQARWYQPASGIFLSRDPFAGFPKQSYSLYPYQYGYSNPLRWIDPSGEHVITEDNATDQLIFDRKTFSEHAEIGRISMLMVSASQIDGFFNGLRPEVWMK